MHAKHLALLWCRGALVIYQRAREGIKPETPEQTPSFHGASTWSIWELGLVPALLPSWVTLH